MYLPAVDGSSSFESFVDFHLSHNPTSAYAVFPQQSDEEELRVSFLEWGRAVHRAARLLRPGLSASKGEVVALIVNCDTLIYTAVLMGMIRAGLTPFPISSRNSAPAVCSMLEKTNCHRLVTTSGSLHGLLEDTKTELDIKGYELQVEEIPSLRDLFPCLGKEGASDDFHPYPALDKQQLDDVLIYIHSSGSTGFPKPIPQTVKIIFDWCNQPCAMDVRGLDDALVLGVMALPSFHTLGFTMQILLPLVTGKRIALFRPQFPSEPVHPNPDNTMEALISSNSTSVIAVPSFFESWASSEEAVQFLATLEFAASSGGPLSTKVGDRLVSRGVRLVSLYGATEMGIPMSPLPSTGGKDPEDWQYIAITDRSLPRWVPQDDGSYELQMLNTATHHLAKLNLDDVEGYATSDVFVKHPSKPDLWKVVGRSDDVLILANGEKTVPGPMEGTVLAHPAIQGVVMFGRERNQVGILVEPKTGYAFDPKDETALAAFRNKLWPVVEEANESAPAFSRIFKEMILVTSPWKPLVRAPKGTVMRKAILAEYAQEIENLYETVEASTKAGDVAPPESWAAPVIMDWLVAQAADVNRGLSPEVDLDLFAQGFDSLSATFLKNRIIGALRSSQNPSVKDAAARVSQNIVFAHPTIRQLANKLASIVDPSTSESAGGQPTAEILDMIAKYSATLPIVAEPKPVVLLTGSTGTLGTHILFQLIQSENVTKIYAYNRKSSAGSSLERQKAAFADKGFDVSRLEDAVTRSKIVFLEGEAARDNLGLEIEIFEELRNTCTHIIHNAWRLDFNLSLSSFESHIAGTRNLLSLALSSPSSSHIRFLFTSSISVLQNWDTKKGWVPEEGHLDAEVAVGPGYGESKYIAEQLILNAPLQSTSFRIGQISGGTPSGSWALTDWVPILIKSSIALGSLPNSNGVISWIPMHSVASTILDVAFAPTNVSLPRTLHVIHPRPVRWTDIMQEVREALVNRELAGIAPVPVDQSGKVSGVTTQVPLTPFNEWIARVQERSTNPTKEDLETIPAIKLLDFFKSLAEGDLVAEKSGLKEYETGNWARLATTEAVRVSQTMKDVPQIGKNDVSISMPPPEPAMKWSAKFGILTDLRLAIQGASWPTLSAIIKSPSLLLHPHAVSEVFMSHVWVGMGAAVDEGGKQVKEGLVTPHAHGVVLDIGAGHGHTVQYLDRRKVTKYIALEPNAHMHDEIRKSAARGGYTESTGTLQILPYGAEALPQILSALAPKPQCVDTLISILSLCSFPSDPPPSDVLTGLVATTLKPGGIFLFYEHVASPREEVRWWQWFWTWLWSAACGGCRLDRDTPAIVREMGVRDQGDETGMWREGDMWGKEGEDVDNIFWHSVGRFVKA
ncbi:acetyl-CoA synthetase-like protein [Heliocybe sulcata]|uniref:Acetyl-CoA synthetase-like protein n=1 Tax=Heliocybe sulcata TaxID=5364 RepID=A0A5C3N1J1_9AGAM|nr:acetyl-CoA synthetase-like protein [Heliocybe sulcata]